MVDARGWSIVAALCLLVLLCASGGRGQPHPVPFDELPPASGPVTTVQRTDGGDAPIVTVSGRVVTRGGSPMPGAVVTLRTAVHAGCGGCGTRTTGLTAADGRFALVVPEGRYLLVCTTPEARPCGFPGAGGGGIDVSAPVADVRLTASRTQHPHPR